jgi:hypothetical protein
MSEQTAAAAQKEALYAMHVIMPAHRAFYVAYLVF